jgi:hypothetical protein
MNIYHTPYTYLIGWSKLNLWYYGARYAKNCHPSDLWVTYFTSSKYVRSLSIIKGPPDVIQIRKTFKSVNRCRVWEERVLTRLNVIHNTKWINRTNNRAICPLAAASGRIGIKGKTYEEIYGIEKAAALKASRTESNIQRGERSPDTKKKISDTRKKLQSENKLVVVFSDTFIARQSLPFPKVPNITCVHCGISCSKGNYVKWHGQRCKLFSDLTNR